MRSLIVTTYQETELDGEVQQDSKKLDKIIQWDMKRKQEMGQGGRT